MILVGQYDSPYVRRCAIALHQLGLPFERNRMSVFADAAAMARINPVVRIPSLVLADGEVVIDSAVILDHIDQVVGPVRALCPPAGAARRRALRIAALASGTTDKTGAYCYEKLLRPAALQYAPWLERCLGQVTGGLAALEAEAAGLSADRPGVAEITVGCLIAYVMMRQREQVMPAGLFGAASHPRLVALSAALEAQPAFRATQAAADETMPSGL